MSLLSLPERFLQRLVELPLELFSMILGSQKAITQTYFPEYESIWARRGWLDLADRYDPVGSARIQRRRYLEKKRLVLTQWRDLGTFIASTPTPILLPGRQYRKRVREDDTGLPAAKRQSVFNVSWL
tara:strand:+ start:444 stop:824 length:381 start_codon:yes stop_codon:yes gene_type:complete